MSQMYGLDFNAPEEGILGGTIQRANPRYKGRGVGRDQETRVRLERRKNMLNLDRMTHWPNWMDLAENFAPMRGRFLIPDGWDTNKGYRRNWAIVDATPLISANTLAAGMVAGVTSKSRPWFQYSVEDERLLEQPGVKEWLDYATRRGRVILARSNFYNAAFENYRELGVWGIMALGREWPWHEDTPMFAPFTIGEYYVGQDKHRRINSFFRDFMWTVEQIVEKFTTGPLDKESSWDNVSERVRALWFNEQYYSWLPVTHAVYENEERVKASSGGFKADASGMRFRSCFYERGGDPQKLLQDSNWKDQWSLKKDGPHPGVLRERGFRNFPVFVARWYVNSEDVWPRGPGMDALGDARALQLQQKRKAQAIDKLVDPPMKAHPSLRNQRTSLLPGDVTFVAPEAGTVGFEPVYPNFKPEIQALLEDIKESQDRVKSIFYTDIFAMFINEEAGGQKMTAAEVSARQQEKLLMLGPVLEQLNYEFLNPLHEWLVEEMLHRGELPPLPKAMRGNRVHVTYTSILANAINAVTFSSIQQFTGYATQVAQASAEAQNNPALDKVNFDGLLEEAAKATQIPPSGIRSDAEVEEIRKERQQQAQAQAAAEQRQQMAETLAQHADTAQKLSQTPAPGGGGGSALDTLATAVGAGGAQQ